MDNQTDTSAPAMWPWDLGFEATHSLLEGVFIPQSPLVDTARNGELPWEIKGFDHQQWGHCFFFFRRLKKVLRLHCSDFKWVYSFPSYPILWPPSMPIQRQPIVSLACVLFQKYFMSRHTECIYVHIIFAIFSPTEAYYTMVGNGAKPLKAAIQKPGFLISNPGSTI